MKAWLKNSFSEAAWAPVTVFAVYAIAAKGLNVYILYPLLDMPTHFFGGVAITYFFLAAVAHSEMLTGAIPKVIQLPLALGLAAITAVVWEFLEYISDVAFGTKMNLGVSDTMSDLFFGLLGGTVMIVFATRSARFDSAFSRRADNEA